MKRTGLVIGRKVSVVVCGVLIFNWVLFLGAIIFIGITGDTGDVIRFFRELSGAGLQGDWDPWPFVFVQVVYLFLTVGSALLAIHIRRRIEALK